MRKVIERLQGARWHNMKRDLILVEYMENQNGHIKGYYADKEGNVYSHWLNDDEIKIMKEGKFNNRYHINRKIKRLTS